MKTDFAQIGFFFIPLKRLETKDIKKVVSEYLESMPFDGIYSNMALIDAIQKVDGVRVAEVLNRRQATEATLLRK